MTLRPLIFALACALPLGSALADARINYRSTEGGGAQMEGLLIGHGKVRSDSGDTSVIFEADSGAMVILDHGKRQFTRIGRAEMEQLGETLGVAMRQMEQAMANVPPEMRERVRGMMGGAIPGMGGEPMVKVEDTGRRDSVAGHSCTIYRTRMSGQVINEQCMGDTSVLDGLSPADRATLDRALAATSRMMEELSNGPLAQFADLSPFKAGMVPLRVTDLEGGRRSTSEFAGIENANLDAGLFAVPSGYREQKLEMPKL
ncbi:DUF4412 domain-containing protein [Pseudofulvimonas gallinarii]|jgi:hypothetical protein|uniref:Uncharacterized protein DUF4412 n=1 Tax=Pseudofulvimonas gallinarii TaxID=634155 RepID=A0A4R3LFU1_9GAMM|nr:DUF4412 domain-containing protein [Pseudofulvimonas gallinarii]TCS98832.1 uncharacterized protein DUF4412 [Pseudofulvimonas gallinarii]